MTRSINRWLGVVAVAVALGGCGSTPSKQAPAPVAAAPAVPIIINEGVRQEYAMATRALTDGRLEEAERLLLELTRKEPELYGPYANLGMVYARKGDVASAEGAFQKAASLKPDAAVIYNEMGIMYRNAGRFEDARKAYERALEIDPKYANAHLNIGILYDLYLLDYKNAAKHYKRYQRLVPEQDAQVSQWLADLKRRQ